MILYFAVMLAAVSIHAQVPRTMSYQGVLKDGSGVIVPDDDYTFEFRIYTTSTGGLTPWTETQIIHLTGGLLNATLGAVNPLVLPFDVQYWLGISIDGGPELLPRTPLTGAPYALNAQQLRGGTNFVPSSGDVGLGTVAPMSNLHIYENIDNTMGITLENPNTGANSTQRIGFNDENGTVAGIAIYDVSSIYPQQMRVFNNRPAGEVHLRNETGSVILDDTGNVGIDQAVPVELLDVNGAVRIGYTGNTNNGTIRYTGSDFEGYVGSAWHSLTSGGGSSLPAGTSGQTLRHNGSDWVSDSYLFNAGYGIGINTVTPEAALHVDGIGQFGSSTHNGTVRVHMSGSPYTVVALGTAAWGGELSITDDEANNSCYLAADADGDGAGYLTVYRGYPDPAFHVDGNFGGTGYPFISMDGLSSVVFQGNIAGGNNSLYLPNGSVSAVEIMDEAGVGSVIDNGIVVLDGTVETLLSRTINVPYAGYVLAIATVESFAEHYTGSASSAAYGVSRTAGVFPASQDVHHSVSASASTGIFSVPVTVHGLFPVSAGSQTFYLLAERESGGYAALNMKMTVVYLPTNYGTVDPTVASSGDDDRPVQSSALTAADIEAEKRESEAVNAKRLEDEVARLRAEVDQLMSKMREEMPEKR